MKSMSEELNDRIAEVEKAIREEGKGPIEEWDAKRISYLRGIRTGLIEARSLLYPRFRWNNLYAIYALIGLFILITLIGIWSQ